MLVNVDPIHLESLRAYVSAQGFRATRVRAGLLEVLFPASPALFAAAVELDDWLARTGAGASSVELEDGPAQPVRARATCSPA